MAACKGIGLGGLVFQDADDADDEDVKMKNYIDDVHCDWTFKAPVP